MTADIQARADDLAERVARALLGALKKNPDAYVGADDPVEPITVDEWGGHLGGVTLDGRFDIVEAARAAIEAVRGSAMQPQQPPADELASTRAAIAALEKREAELRTLMLTDPSARTGNKVVAEIVTVKTSRVDLKELRAMHADILEAYTFTRDVQKVELRAISADGEITNRPRQRRA
jgi:hypothetical protein